MGRPLYSSTIAAPEPAVRVEPEPQQPQVEKWTYWNAFDPDSDEFFTNDNAVYEAFVDVAHPPTIVEIVEDGMSTSSGSSDASSSSGRGSPMELTDDALVEDEARVDPGTYSALRAPSEMVSQYANMYHIPSTARERIPTFIDVPNEPSRSPSPELDLEPRTPVMRSVPIPIPRPSTPPSRDNLEPSPPPSVTPRLYSWGGYTGRQTPASSYPMLPPSPLSNRSARRSVARIVASPVLVGGSRAA